MSTLLENEDGMLARREPISRGQSVFNTVREFDAIILYRYVKWDDLTPELQLGFEQFAEEIGELFLESPRNLIEDLYAQLFAVNHENETLRATVAELQDQCRQYYDLAQLTEVHKENARHWRKFCELMVKEMGAKK